MPVNTIQAAANTNDLADQLSEGLGLDLSNNLADEDAIAELVRRKHPL